MVAFGKNELLELLARLGIRFEVAEHVPVMTVQESAFIHEDIPGLACKCLFLRDKGGSLWLAAVPSAMRVDLKALAAALGCGRLSFGPPELMHECLGLLPGAVSVFGAANDSAWRVTVVIEKSLLQADLVCFHPLVNTATVSLAPEDLLLFLRHTGHEARMADGIDAA